MAIATDSIIEKIKMYIAELENINIHINGVIIFGSYAKGTAAEDSDIDVAIISEDFTGDRFAEICRSQEYRAIKEKDRQQDRANSFQTRRF